jgi:hypothetical protein
VKFRRSGRITSSGSVNRAFARAGLDLKIGDRPCADIAVARLGPVWKNLDYEPSISMFVPSVFIPPVSSASLVLSRCKAGRCHLSREPSGVVRPCRFAPSAGFEFRTYASHSLEPIPMDKFTTIIPFHLANGSFNAV